jgi:uracil-DNA glycosylase
LLAPYACTIDIFLAADESMFKGVAGILPKPEAWFAAFAQCDFADTKVVIIGDTFNSPEWATGLAYSIPAAADRPMPAATAAILAEVAAEFGKQHSPDLTDWGKQGVLLLNRSLTSREACKSTAHLPMWEPFTDKIIKYTSENLEGVVYMLWGEESKSKVRLIDEDKHLVLRAAHPTCCGHKFAGCNHFAVANNWLVSRSRLPVMWV